jgi:membrane dipeptidase
MSKLARRLELWDGYVSHSYLSQGRGDDIKFAEQLGRAPEASITWDEAVEAKARAFEEAHVIASAHDHLSLRPADPARFAEYRRTGRESIPYEGIAHSGVDWFFDGGPAAVSMIRSHTSWDWDDTVADLAMRTTDLSKQQLVRPIRSLADLDEAQAKCQVGLTFTLESASPIGNDLDRLDLLYGLGVRLIGLVYSESNLLGGGLADVDAGLTKLGRAAVRRLNELGMIIDLSHAGDATTLDAVRTSGQPVVITHAGSRSVWPTSRMKPDDVIKACADSGGFIGIEAAPNTTASPDHSRHDLEAVMHHVEHCLELVGPDHVVLGPDTNFGDHVAWHREFSAMFGKDSAREPAESIDYVYGCENPAEATRNMLRWLIAHNYSESEITKITGGNLLRVTQAVWRS